MPRMRRVTRYAGLATAMIALWAGVAAAGTTTERSGSILIFPKVLFDGGHDTLVQITNTKNSVVHAHCFYVNAAPICSSGVGDCLAHTCTGSCDPQWQEVDFNIWLTGQQPTHWAVGSGRFTNPLDVPCDPLTPNYDCDGAGLDPGRIPPVTDPFRGELRCIEIDPSGAPINGNSLKGEATLLTDDGDASKYNAVALIGEPNQDTNFTLCLGGGVTDDCPSGAEYEGCGQLIKMTHFAEGADSPLFGPTSTVSTELTLVPCAADFEFQKPTSIVVHFDVTNEFEQPLSALTTIDCWGDFFFDDVSNIFKVRTVGTRLLQTELRAADGSQSGFVGVVEEFHSADGGQGRTAFNLHEEGTRAETDLIRLPEGP
jgi:hypothetical protein